MTKDNKNYKNYTKITENPKINENNNLITILLYTNNNLNNNNTTYVMIIVSNTQTKTIEKIILFFIPFPPYKMLKFLGGL